MAMVLVLAGCSSQPVVDEQVTADMVGILAELDEHVDDGDLAQFGPDFEMSVLRPLGERAGRRIKDGLAEGQLPDRGAVAHQLVTAAHGKAFPGLGQMFDTYSGSEAYPQRGSDPEEAMAGVRENIEFAIMAMGALLAADRDAAAQIEQIVAGADDPFGTYMDNVRASRRDSGRPEDFDPIKLHNQIDTVADMITTSLVTSPGGRHGWTP